MLPVLPKSATAVRLGAALGRPAMAALPGVQARVAAASPVPAPGAAHGSLFPHIA